MENTERFQVTGMTCSHCERAVRDAILALDPQARVQIDLASGAVDIDSTLPRAALAAAMADEGYTVA